MYMQPWIFLRQMIQHHVARLHECMADALKLQSWQERISACILKYIGKNIHSSLVAAYRTKE